VGGKQPQGEVRKRRECEKMWAVGRHDKYKSGRAKRRPTVGGEKIVRWGGKGKRGENEDRSHIGVPMGKGCPKKKQ